MEQYINKSALVAEIDRKIEAHKETLKNCDSSISETVLKGSMSAYLNLLHFIGTLEVKEVDLDNELDFVKDAYYYFTSDERSSMKKVAEHFFELGLKAQKGE